MIKSRTQGRLYLSGLACFLFACSCWQLSSASVFAQTILPGSIAQDNAKAKTKIDPAFAASIARIERHIALYQISESDFEDLTKMLEKRPDDSYARFLLARCFERQGLVELAQEQFQLLDKIEKAPEDLLRRLRHHIAEGEVSEAFKMLTLPVFSYSQDPSLILIQGMFMQENGSSQNAELIFLSLLKRDDCPLGTATALAKIRMEKQNWQAAITLANRDLKLNPSYVSAIQVKAHSLLKMGQSEKAERLLAPTLKLYPFNSSLNLLMYKIQRHMGKNEEALRCALRNLALSDYISFYEPAKFRIEDSLTLIPRARSNQIVKEVSELVDKTYYAMKFHFYLAQIYYKKGWAKEALEQIQTALDMDPVFQPNWYQRGKIKEMLFADLHGAGADFKKARSLQRSDYKNYVAFQRIGSRMRNEKRDLAYKIKVMLKNRNWQQK